MKNTSNKLIEKYYSLNGKTITRSELSKFHIELFDTLPEENKQLIEIWHKIGDVLYKYPNATEFKITIKNPIKIETLNAPRHSGIGKEALTECGRLKKGYRYVKGGKIEKKTPTKKKSNVKKSTKKTTKKKVVKTPTKKKPIVRKKPTPKKPTKQKVIGYALVDNITGEIVTTEKTLQQIEWFYEKHRDKQFKDLEILAYEIIKVGNKNKLGKKINYEKNSTRKFVDELFNDVDKKPTKKQPVKVNKVTKQTALFGGKKQSTTIKVEAEQSTLEHKGATNVPAPLINGLKPVNIRTNNKAHEYYKITGDIATLLGNIEVKPVNSVAVTLDAPQGAGKTRAFFQFINEFASNGYKVLFVSAEEHPQSSLFQKKLDQYVQPENQNNVFAIDSTNFNEISQLILSFDIVFFDSWNKIAEKNKGIDFDSDLRKKFDSKLFFAIFQRTGTGTMRGGSKAQFDGDIILKIVKENDFKENYVIADKNRYTNEDIHEIKYNIFHQKLVNEAPTEEEVPTTPETEENIVIIV